MKNKVNIRSFLSLLIMTLCSLNSFPQADTVRNPDQFIFPEFSVGVAKLKSGEKVVLDLNYNIVTEKMVFMQDKQIYNIVNEQTIDTVYMQGQKFIPSGKVFFEVVVKGSASFFIQHKGSVQKPDRPAAYGGTSKVSSSTYINNLRMGNDVFRMREKAEIVIIPGPIYWVGIGGELYNVTGKKSLLKIFSDRKQDISKFIEKPDFNWEDPEQVAELVRLYNRLTSP